jgi:hypothetical protein
VTKFLRTQFKRGGFIVNNTVLSSRVQVFMETTFSFLSGTYLELELLAYRVIFLGGGTRV